MYYKDKYNYCHKACTVFAIRLISNAIRNKGFWHRAHWEFSFPGYIRLSAWDLQEHSICLFCRHDTFITDTAFNKLVVIGYLTYKYKQKDFLLYGNNALDWINCFTALSLVISRVPKSIYYCLFARLKQIVKNCKARWENTMNQNKVTTGLFLINLLWPVPNAAIFADGVFIFSSHLLRAIVFLFFYLMNKKMFWIFLLHFLSS